MGPLFVGVEGPKCVKNLCSSGIMYASLTYVEREKPVGIKEDHTLCQLQLSFFQLQTESSFNNHLNREQ